MFFVDSAFSNVASCLLVRPGNTSGALNFQVPEFSSRVVKEGACCNFIFGYLHMMLIPRFVVVDWEQTSQFCRRRCLGPLLGLSSCAFLDVLAAALVLGVFH